MATTHQLQELFRQALGLPADMDVSGLTYRSVPQWDSIAHMRLVARIEDALDVMLDTDEVLDLSSFSACTEILARHGIRFDD